ncbi:CarboxypepD_reg-like domain-containing protein [Belliella buryatensis]|uniref:CarboxypepD_reg-like domain-containing protein n=1 Tax=Belliella buryatensis TaxID=1500549 RepID=A0A239B801_9BACT|nr:carboxypeptidase-like regulatory domain-containing protein [Belliella buryatensis]SNS04000.1 CarboxypepD_reg-like domain-containing protein [Belliella buryatensis]
MKKSIQIYFIAIFFGLQFHHLDAQVVRGKVVDSKTGDAVPYVNIFLENYAKGTVTNAEGEFNFRLPENISKTDTLAFSHVGYSRYRLSVREAISKEKLMVTLQFGDQELMEALVTTLDPKKIMKKMQDNLTSNMYSDAYEVEIFGREYIQDQNDYQGIARARGFLHVEPFDLKQSKKNANSYHFLAFDHVQKSDYGIINNRTGRIRSSQFLVSYSNMIFEIWDFKLSWFDFELLGQKIIDDRKVYIIKSITRGSGISNKGSRWLLSHYGLLEDATFYIDQEDYGVHMMELGQKYTGNIETNKYILHQWKRDERNAIVKFRRNDAGYYFFSYANQSQRYTSLGYKTEKNPGTREVYEFGEVYAMDYEFVDLTNEALAIKYKAPVFGEKPMRRIRYPVPSLNGWMFLMGDPRYNQDFWKTYEYPPMAKENEIEKALSKNKSLEEQYKSFSNDQRYLLPIIRRKYNLEGVDYWSVERVQNQFQQSAATLNKYGYFK